MRLAGLLCALTVGGLPVARAESVVARPEASVDWRVAQLVGRVARELKKPAPVIDPALNGVALELAQKAPPPGQDPEPRLLDRLFFAHGVVEPVRRVLLASYPAGEEDDFLSGLPPQLRVLLTSGRWARFGFAVAPGPTGDRSAVLLVLESFLRMQPLPSRAPLGGEPLLVAGQLLPPYRSPRVVITEPSGAVRTLFEKPQADRFRAELRCQDNGVYKLEVLGEDRGGPTVLANFPLTCGTPPPPTPEPSPAQVGERTGERDAEKDTAAVERRLFELLNRERSQRKLPPFRLDARLSAIARAHCEDMRRTGSIAHISPTSGSPKDRVERAKLPALRVAENLAQAPTAAAVHEGLMDSPGHRAAILEPELTLVGIGVVPLTLAGGGRSLLVTELYIRPPP